MSYHIRTATLAQCAAIGDVIARSARALGRSDYTQAQIEGALRGAFGLDTQLINDKTYYVVLTNDQIVGCGGWSYRATVFGSDQQLGRDARRLDPDTDAARIRAFFVDPQHARRGIGRMLLRHCEQQAAAMGFKRFELMATLPGERLYREHGYRATKSQQHPLEAGLTITFVAMTKKLDPEST